MDGTTHGLRCLPTWRIDRLAMSADRIRQLVDEDLGGYSGFMILLQRGSLRSPDLPTHRDACSRSVAGRYFRPIFQVRAAR